MFLMFSFLIIVLLSCRIHVTKALIHILFIFPHMFIRILFFLLFIFVSSLPYCDLHCRMQVPQSPTEDRQTDHIHHAARYDNQTVVGLSERSPADHEPIIHSAVKQAHMMMSLAHLFMGSYLIFPYKWNSVCALDKMSNGKCLM